LLLRPAAHEFGDFRAWWFQTPQTSQTKMGKACRSSPGRDALRADGAAMIDIVERLQAYPRKPHQSGDDPFRLTAADVELYAEAAAEIERLRDEVTRLDRVAGRAATLCGAINEWGVADHHDRRAAALPPPILLTPSRGRH
jgi:hypothetical protein